MPKRKKPGTSTDKKTPSTKRPATEDAARTGADVEGYDGVLHGLVDLLEAARRASARSVNAIMTATYWEVGRRIVEYEQGGAERAEYAERLLELLAVDLGGRFGRGFSRENLRLMRLFYLTYPINEISQTPSGKSTRKNVSRVPAQPSSTRLIDLLFFHRRLRCLVIIDLKLGEFTHADAGQMHLYLNYAREHWTHSDENPPVGLVLCTEKNEAVAHYALDGLPNKILAAKYRTVLPDEQLLTKEVERTRRALEARTGRTGKRSKR